MTARKKKWAVSQSAIEEVLLLITHRQQEIVFDDILGLIDSLKLPLHFCLLVRQRKIFEEAARFEHNGYLISPFYSLIYEKGARVALDDPSILRRQLEICRSPKYQSIEFENVVLYYNKNDQNKHSIPSSLLEQIATLLAAYFYTFGFDAALSATARRYQYESQNTSEVDFAGFDQLCQTNYEQFSIKSAFVVISGGGPIEVIRGNLTASRLQNSKTLLERIRYCVNSHRTAAGIEKRKTSRCYYKIIPISGVLRNQKRTIGCFVLLSSKGRLPLHAARFNEIAVDEIYSAHFVRARSTAITELQRQIIDYSIARNVQASLKERAAQFDKFSTRVVSVICSTTHAHSATVRLYEPFERVLRLRALCNKQDAMYRSNRPSEETNNRHDISIDNSSSSVNAFCFHYTDPGSFVYIRDVSSLPADVASRGLRNVTIAREKTVSEFCIPLYWQDLRIGVMNIEGPFSSAFELDEEYLSLLSFLVSQFWFLVHFGTDRYWLSQLSFAHLATHELADFQRSLTGKQREQFNSIVSTLRFHRFKAGTGQKNIAHLVDFATSRAKKISRQSAANGVVRCDAALLDLGVNPSMYASLQLILESMLRNAKKHSDISSDTIEFGILKTLSGTYKELQIVYSSKGAFVDPERAEGFFYQPSSSVDGLHYGLFLIGAHTRLLGGNVFVNPSCIADVGYGPFGYMLRIPYREEEA